MAFNAYDFDGVLCNSYNHTGKKYGLMNGQERREYQQKLVNHYLTAAQIFVPNEQQFHIITARKKKEIIIEATNDWIKEFLPEKSVTIHFLDIPRTYENVAKFKSNIINKLGIENFYEDNLIILKKMKRLTNCKLYYFEHGFFTLI